MKQHCMSTVTKALGKVALAALCALSVSFTTVFGAAVSEKGVRKGVS